MWKQIYNEVEIKYKCLYVTPVFDMSQYWRRDALHPGDLKAIYWMPVTFILMISLCFIRVVTYRLWAFYMVAQGDYEIVHEYVA